MRMIGKAVVFLLLAALLGGGCSLVRGRVRPPEEAFAMDGYDHALLTDGEAASPLAVVRNTRDEHVATLRQTALPVSPAYPLLPLLAERMRATMDAEEGVGIAAPQVGVLRRVIWVRRLDKGPDMPAELCLNPQVIARSEDEEEDWEGCLSVVGGFGKVTRPRAVTVRCQGLDGAWRDESVSGRTARIFLHEIDHLDGVLFIDRMAWPPVLLPKEEYRALRAREREEEAEKAEKAKQEP